MNQDAKNIIIDLINSRSSTKVDEAHFTFSDALSQYIDYDFTEIEAEIHWTKIVARHAELERKLNKKVSLYLAIVDYFTGENAVFNSPVLVEIKVLREAESMAMIDSLTGVFNRRYMEVALRKEVNRCNRYDKSFTIMLLDIDDFKKLNDSHGHVTGDEVLKDVASVIKSTIREEDVLCRYGGEEFLIIMPETTSVKAISLYARIQNALAISKSGQKYNITLSAGCSNFTANAENLVDLIRCADISLYQAKKAGKNRIFKYE